MSNARAMTGGKRKYNIKYIIILFHFNIYTVKYYLYIVKNWLQRNLTRLNLRSTTRFSICISYLVSWCTGVREWHKISIKGPQRKIALRAATRVQLAHFLVVPAHPIALETQRKYGWKFHGETEDENAVWESTFSK